MEYARAALPAVPLFQDLYLCTAGKSVCCPGHGFGPDVRLNYLIHCVLSGKGCFETDEKQYFLSKGQGFLIEPGLTTRYFADDAQPWSYIWIGFNGTLAPKIVKTLGLGPKRPVFSFKNLKELEETADKLLLPASSDTELSLNQHTLLLSFFHLLAQNLAGEGGDGADSRSNYHIYKALSFIRSNYANQIRVIDVANYLGINRFYLSDLFQKTMGHSPQEYISSFCLGRAREMLTTTNIPVTEIAYACGYSNIEIFSKAFKRKYLASPSQYRKYALEHPGVNPMDYIRKLKEERTARETQSADPVK